MNAKQINKPPTEHQGNMPVSSLLLFCMVSCSSAPVRGSSLFTKYLSTYCNVTFIFPKPYGIFITSQALGHYHKLETRL